MGRQQCGTCHVCDASSTRVEVRRKTSRKRSRSATRPKTTSLRLEALLASDADADEAGAAVVVRAGSFDDTYEGLAHFHEHMLFLGTEKYPGEDEYDTFL